MNQFWFQPLEDKTLDFIQEKLNNFDNDLTPFSDVRSVTPGLMVAAKYNDLFYRGVVRSFNNLEDKNFKDVFEVCFFLFLFCFFQTNN